MSLQAIRIVVSLQPSQLVVNLQSRPLVVLVSLQTVLLVVHESPAATVQTFRHQPARREDPAKSSCRESSDHSSRRESPDHSSHREFQLLLQRRPDCSQLVVNLKFHCLADLPLSRESAMTADLLQPKRQNLMIMFFTEEGR